MMIAFSYSIPPSMKYWFSIENVVLVVRLLLAQLCIQNDDVNTIWIEDARIG